MKIFEYALITDFVTNGENSAIVKVFAQHHGALKGFVRRIKIKNKSNIFEKGNVLKINYFQREGTLGNMTGESYSLYMNSCMHDQRNMKLILTICECLNICFHIDDKNDHANIFEKVIYCLESIKRGLCFEENVFNLIILIKNILAFCGYSFRLTQCVVTGNKNIDELVFLSPKSAASVCRESGQEYKNIMFKLPKCFITEKFEDILEKKDLEGCLQIISFFINKNFNKHLSTFDWLIERIK